MAPRLSFPLLAAALLPQHTRAADKPMVADEEVHKAVYDKNYKVPKGFVEDHALKDPNHSLYFHQPGWFADDKTKARQVVQDFLDKPSNIQVRKIEQEKETPRSFDFRGGTIWYRVHRPGYFAWKGQRVSDSHFNFQANGKPRELGQLKVRPLTREAVKEFAEYDWLVQYYNLGGAKVLKSDTSEEGAKFVHTLLTTQVVFGDFGLSDEIDVVVVRYSVDKKTGTTTRSAESVKKLKGRRN